MADHVYKTKVTVEVLSNEPPDDVGSLSNLAYQCIEGDFSCRTDVGDSIKLEGDDAIRAITMQGSDPSFFDIDEG